MGGALTIFVVAYAGIQAVNVIATKMLKGKEMIKSAFNLVSLASGLAIMAGALKIISSIKDDDIWRSVGIIRGPCWIPFLTVSIKPYPELLALVVAINCRPVFL